MYGSSSTDQDLYVGGFSNSIYSGPAFYFDKETDRYMIGVFERGELTYKTYEGEGKVSID